MKTKIGVFFGGRTVEHEISIITANQAMSSINTEKYEIIPVYISKKGLMYTGEGLQDLQNYKDLDALVAKLTQVTLINDGDNTVLLRYPSKKLSDNVVNTIDVAFPCMHGKNGEDGTAAGYFEMINVPYIGPDILASSVGMDKIMMRRAMKQAGIPSLDFVAFYVKDYIKDEEKHLKEIEDSLRYPVIVKAGNLGSSVGIKVAKNHEELIDAIEYSMQYTDRIMVENAIENLKEINCSVMGEPSDCRPSEVEEPLGAGEILSYQDKYVSGGSKGGAKGDASSNSDKGMASLNRRLPADIPTEMKEEIQKYAVETFKVLGCRGVSRIDFLVDNDTNEVFVNEINTIPGALSFYLWEATGTSFEEEIDELVALALKRQRERAELTFSYSQNILALQGTKTGSKS